MFLRNEQNALLAALGRRSPHLAEIYYGGLRCLADDGNPFRLQLAAHAFREVLAHLASLTGQSVVFGDGMKNRIKPVKSAFVAWRTSRSSVPGVVGISEDLESALGNYFDWEERNRPDFRKQTAMMLTQLAGPTAALPSDVVGDEISAWMEIDGFFKLVAHSTHRTTINALVSKLFIVEDILLRRLTPRPVSDLTEIDALLAEDDYAE